MKKHISFLITISFLFISFHCISQETFTHPDADVDITLPAGWYYEIDESEMIASTSDESLALTFSVMETESVDDVLDALDDMLDEEFDYVELGEVEYFELNGMPALILDGVADDLICLFVIIDAPAPGMQLIITEWSVPDVIEKYEDDVDFIIENIVPSEQ